MDPILLTEKVLGVIASVLLTLSVGYITKQLPILIPIFIAYTQTKVAHLRSNFTQQELDTFDFLVRQIVQAVEQKVKIGEIIAHTGAAKKAIALDLLKAECERLGIPFDVDAADKALESAISQGWQAAAPVFAAIQFPAETQTEAAK